MKKENTVTEWSDFTNKVFSVFGKFLVIPLVIIGSLICLLGNVFVGLLLVAGPCLIILLVALILIAFKPLIIKKYPDPKPELNLRPITFVVDLPDMEPREETVMTSGKYRVSSSLSRLQLTKLQKLAVDKCKGDMEAAWYYLVTYMSHEDQDAYTKDLTPQETAAYMSLLNIQAKQKYTKKELQGIVNQCARLAYLDMSAEQVITAEKNPFTKRMWISVSILLVCSITFGVLIGLGVESEFLGAILPGCLGLVMTFYVYKVVADILNYFRFKKARRVELEERAKKDTVSG